MGQPAAKRILVRPGEDTKYVDAEGTPFPLGRGREAVKFGCNAPGFIRSRGEQSYSLTKLFRALAEADPSLAPYEFDMSKRLAMCGYPISPKSVLVPLGDSVLYRNPGYEADIDAIAMEFKQSFPIPGG